MTKRSSLAVLAVTAVTAVTVVAVAAALAHPAEAVDLSKLQKGYFAGTRAGSWARYEQVTTDAKGKVTTVVQTVSRLENEGDRVWMETRTEPKEGKKKASTAKFLMKTDFRPEKNALDFLNYIDRVIMQEDGGKAQEMPIDQFRAFTGGISVDYGVDVEAKGSESVEGKACDRFGMKGSFDVKILFMRMKGTWVSDVWLSDGVPFGRVKESIATSDEKGKLMSRTESRLLEAGSGAVSRIKGPVEKVEIPKLPFGG